MPDPARFGPDVPDPRRAPGAHPDGPQSPTRRGRFVTLPRGTAFLAPWRSDARAPSFEIGPLVCQGLCKVRRDGWVGVGVGAGGRTSRLCRLRLRRALEGPSDSPLVGAPRAPPCPLGPPRCGRGSHPPPPHQCRPGRRGRGSGPSAAWGGGGRVGRLILLNQGPRPVTRARGGLAGVPLARRDRGVG